MFTSSVIRKLSRSEEMFAQTQNFVGLGSIVKGAADVDALATVFDALLEAYPVLGGRLERDVDGRHQFVVDDLVHPGINVVELDDPTAESPAPHLDQTEALTQMRVVMRDGHAELTLYIHHAVADGHHEFSLVEQMFTWYTNLIVTGNIGPVTVQPAPDPLEVILADRGIHKQKRSGLERFMPAVFAYDLPPSRRAASGVETPFPVRVPMVSRRLDEDRTDAVYAFCRENRIGLNSLLSAVVLLAEWKLRGTPHIPIPYVYPVDLRYILSPPVSATGCTNPMGLATYLAEIDEDTSLVGLARDIAAMYRADLADGVIQQSMLHFSPQYVGNPPGLPDIVMLTDEGVCPSIPAPPGVEVHATEGELYFAVNAGIDLYASRVAGGELIIDRHSHTPEPENSVAEIHSLLCSIAEEHASAGAR